MRISDWSSDVCSSDLLVETAADTHDVAIVERTLDCRAGDTGVPQFLRADDRLARYEGFQLFTLAQRSEEHTSELQSLMRISYAVFCLKKKKIKHRNKQNI